MGIPADFEFAADGAAGRSMTDFQGQREGKRLMRRRDFVRSVGLPTVAVASGLPQTLSAVEGREKGGIPNILVICSDQHHHEKVGYRGNPIVKTPNLGKLAGEGVHFTRAYCSCPVCGPSRMSFMTGKYTHQINCWHNRVPLDPKEMTWARRLDQAGIPSTCLGKIDCPGEYYNPGFTHYKGKLLRKAYTPYPLIEPQPRFVPGWTRAASRRLLQKAGGAPLEDGQSREALGFYDHDREVTDWALDYIKEKGQDSSRQPWALYTGFLYPHWPYRVPKKYFDMYYPDNIELPHDAEFPNEALHPSVREWQQWNAFGKITDDMLRRTIAAYYGMITCMDDMIGEMIAELKKQGLYDNTVIVYTSDHGEALGEHGLFFKQCAYDGSAGVPLLIRGPGIPAGGRVDEPVSLVDLYPTLMEAVGLETERDRAGCSWLPAIQGRRHGYPDTVFAEWHGAGFRSAWYMLVRGGYKYTWYEYARPTLYNLTEDPDEMKDLAAIPAYANLLGDFEERLRAIADPKATAMRAKRDLGLITPEGVDITATPHVPGRES